jgi:hypothetical protein
VSTLREAGPADDTILSIRTVLRQFGISLPEDELAELVPVAKGVREWSETLRAAPPGNDGTVTPSAKTRADGR